jgi:ferredoxin
MSSRAKGKVEAAKQELTVYLPDTRGVTISRWGCGNLKLGMDGVYTYSRLPGNGGGTCPGATEECERICYAKRITMDSPVWDVWARNTYTGRVSIEHPLPPDAKIVRIHVSGDFDTTIYIGAWIAFVKQHPDVRFFSYTRSWRVSGLLFALEQLRALPNVQLFASMDKSMDELPPPGWRRAWLEDDLRAISGGGPGAEQGLEFYLGEGVHNFTAMDGQSVYVCPEETGRKPNCQTCGYCVSGRRGDLVFLLH